MSLRQLKFKPKLQPGNLKAKRDTNKVTETSCENKQDGTQIDNESPTNQSHDSDKQQSLPLENSNEKKNADLPRDSQQRTVEQLLDNEALSTATNKTLDKSHIIIEEPLKEVNDGQRSQAEIDSDVQRKPHGGPEGRSTQGEGSCDVISENQEEFHKPIINEVPRGKVSFSLRQLNFKPKLQSPTITKNDMKHQEPEQIEEATPVALKTPFVTEKPVSNGKVSFSLRQLNFKPKLQSPKITKNDVKPQEPEQIEEEATPVGLKTPITEKQVSNGKVSFSLRQLNFKPKLQSPKITKNGVKPQEPEQIEEEATPVGLKTPITEKQVSNVSLETAEKPASHSIISVDEEENPIASTESVHKSITPAPKAKEKTSIRASHLKPILPDTNKDLIDVIEIDDEIRDHIKKNKNAKPSVPLRQFASKPKVPLVSKKSLLKNGSLETTKAQEDLKTTEVQEELKTTKVQEDHPPAPKAKAKPSVPLRQFASKPKVPLVSKKSLHKNGSLETTKVQDDLETTKVQDDLETTKVQDDLETTKVQEELKSTEDHPPKISDIPFESIVESMKKTFNSCQPSMVLSNNKEPTSSHQERQNKIPKKRRSPEKTSIRASHLKPILPDTNKDLIDVIEIDDDIRDHIKKKKNGKTSAQGREGDTLFIGPQNSEEIINTIKVPDDIEDKLVKIVQNNPRRTKKKSIPGELSASNLHTTDASTSEPFENNIGDILKKMKETFTGNTLGIRRISSPPLSPPPSELMVVGMCQDNTNFFLSPHSSGKIISTISVSEAASVVSEDNKLMKSVKNKKYYIRKKTALRGRSTSNSCTDSSNNLDSIDNDVEDILKKMKANFTNKPKAKNKDGSGDSVEVLETIEIDDDTGDTSSKITNKSIGTDSSPEKRRTAELCDSGIEISETSDSPQDKSVKVKKTKDVSQKLSKRQKFKPKLTKCGNKKPLLKLTKKKSCDAVEEKQDSIRKKHSDSQKSSIKSVDESDSIDLDPPEDNTEELHKDLDELDKELNLKTHKPRRPFKPELFSKFKRPAKLTSATYGKLRRNAQIEFNRKFGDVMERPDSSRLTILDSIVYNPSSNPMPQIKESETTVIGDSKKPKGKENDNSSQNTLDGKDIEERPNETNDSSEVPVPQLKLSADGKIIVSQDSLELDPVGDFMSESEDFPDDRPKNSQKKRRRQYDPRQNWTHEETLKFYKALHSVGADFETMKELFPGRTRGNLKSKFKREEKLHRDLIDKVLFESKEYNVEYVIEELECERKIAEAEESLKKWKHGKRKRLNNESSCLRKKNLKICSSESDSLSAKELASVLRADEVNKGGKRKDEPGRRTGRPARKQKRLIDGLYDALQRRLESDDEDDPSETASQASGEEPPSDHIVISTNVEYENVKYTQYITYNTNNLDNPIDINETISHE